MGSDLQCSRIAFLAVVDVFDVLIFSGALYFIHIIYSVQKVIAS